jgi:Mesyanzhinovviridae DNA primase
MMATLSFRASPSLANGDPDFADYILRWSAWAVQNPGTPAEVALVLKGEKGSGKGTWFVALRRIFGPHGLHIASSKHLIGSFNGHTRYCLFLFADEAFWAGDVQGESELKAMLTEPTRIVEQKFVDAGPIKNRLHVGMAANAAWAVPASHDERLAFTCFANARAGEQRQALPQARRPRRRAVG